MKKVRYYELEGITDADKKSLKECSIAEIEMSIDEYGRVWNEGGQYIADAKIVEP